MSHQARSGRRHKRARPGSVPLLAMALACPAFAAPPEEGQAAPPGGTPPPGTAAAAPGTAAVSATSLQDITVTARKREEYARDVPVAIAALSGAQLQEKNITQLLDLTAVTPNFWLSNGAVQPFTFIRGFGSGSNLGFAQSVGKFVDDVSFGRDQDGRLPLFDIERVEVLKGPQVITFGNSATVGALNITTKGAGRQFEADGSVAYEFNQNEVETQGGVTAPLSDDVSLRIAGMFRKLDRGQLYNALQDRHEPQIRNWALRPTLRLDPADGLEIVLHGEYDHLRDIGGSSVVTAQPLRLGAPQFPIAGSSKRRDIDYNRAPYFTQDGTANRAGLLQADIRYNLLGGTLNSTTAYRRFHALNQFGTDGPDHNPVYYNGINQRYHQFSQELRFTGSYGPVDIQAGGYYQHDYLRSFTYLEFSLGGYGTTGIAATPLGRFSTFDQKAETYSGFTDVTLHATSALSLSAGVRYARFTKSAGQASYAVPIQPFDLGTSRDAVIATASPALVPALVAIAGTTPHVFPLGTLRLTENHWQPQAIVQYKLDSRNTAYAKFVKGAKVGGFDFLYAGSNPAGAAFAPEKAQSYEIGLKGKILAGKLDYAISLFRTTFKDLQQSVFQNLTYVVSNVGKARSQGVEVDLTYVPVANLRLGLSGSYLDAKYLDFKGAACNSDQNLVTPRGCFQDLSGTRTQFASKLSGSASLDYRKKVFADRYELGGGVSVFARSKFNAAAFNDRRMQQSGFAQVDTHVDFGPLGGPWQVTFFGRNLSDKRYLEYGALAPAQSTAVLGSYSRGRQLGLKLSLAVR